MRSPDRFPEVSSLSWSLRGRWTAKPDLEKRMKSVPHSITKRGDLNRRPGTRWAVIAALISAAFAPASRPVHAQQTAATEYQVKAAYLYNFGKFVAWPDKGEMGKGQPFEICVLGEDPFGAALDTVVAGETISGKDVATKRITNPREIDDCRILFISSSEGGRLTDILGALDRTSVLTVSDIPQFSQRGGMIQFVLDGSRVRFEVNLTKAEGAGLNLSSELLKVAVKVTRNPHSGF